MGHIIFSLASHICRLKGAVYLDNNFLSGTIPTTIGALTNMVDLRIGENMLIGSIPSEISTLRILRKSQKQITSHISFASTVILPHSIYEIPQRLHTLTATNSQVRCLLKPSALFSFFVSQVAAFAYAFLFKFIAIPF